MDNNTFGEIRKALEISERVIALRDIAQAERNSKIHEASQLSESDNMELKMKAAAEAVAQEKMRRILNYIIDPELISSSVVNDPRKLEDYITAVLR